MKKLIIALVIFLILVLPASAQEPTPTPQTIYLPIVTKENPSSPPERPPERTAVDDVGTIHGWTWLTYGDWTMPWYQEKSLVFMVDKDDVVVEWRYVNERYVFDNLPFSGNPYTLVGLTWAPFEPPSPVQFGQAIDGIIVISQTTMINLVLRSPPDW